MTTAYLAGAYPDGATALSDLERLIVNIRHVHAGKARLAAAVRIGRLGYWEWSLRHGRIFASDELCLLHGVAPRSLDGSYADLLARVHPDDRAAADLVLRKAAADRQPFEHHHRIVRPDGSIAVLHVRGQLIEEDDGGDDEDGAEAGESAGPGAAGGALKLRERGPGFGRLLGACTDVTEAWTARADLDSALVTARRRLDGAVAGIADREQLLLLVGHELRNPLASMRLSLDALARSVSGDGAAVARNVSIIDRAERRLSRLIEDLLDAGYIRSGQLALNLEPVDLGDLVQEVAERMSPEITRSGSTLTMKVGPGIVGRWDRSRLDQVVSNLLGNAVKFGERRPIELRCGADEHGAYLAVADQGIGIAPEMQRWIFFEPFKRAPGLERTSGLGLGLHIVRTIVLQLGGDILVDSEPGRGATFTVWLPTA